MKLNADLTTPWYKQFWPWFLIILPSCVVIASLVTFKIALDTADSLVAEEYYKRGKAINIDLAKVTAAKNLGIQFLVTAENNKLILTQEGGPEYKAALRVELYHPTQAAKDKQFTLTQFGDGSYRIPVTENMQGPWDLRLENFNNTWRLDKRILLAEQAQYWLN